MCVPSITPAHCGNPLLRKPAITCCSLVPLGKVMYLGRRSLTITLHTSFLMRLTDALEILNKWPIVGKSALLAKYQSVSATLFSTVMAFHIVVSLFISSAFKSLHRYKIVFHDMRRFVSQSSGVKVVPTMWSQPHSTSVSDPYSSCGHEQANCTAAEQQRERHSLPRLLLSKLSLSYNSLHSKDRLSYFLLSLLNDAVVRIITFC